MNDRQLLQQALDALTYKKWWRVGLGEPKDPKLEAAITSLNKRLAHCDRCGKRLGGEGDIHACSPDPIGDAQAKLIAELAVQPEQEPVPENFMDALKFDVAARDAREWDALYTTPPAAQRQHVTDGSLCWCDPETSYTDPETGASVIVHKGPQ